MKGGLALNNVDSAVDLDVLVKFSLRILIIFAVIFVLAYLTPKLAKLVDSWIQKYRKDHPKQETYGVRSIYELPPGPDEEESDYDLDQPYEDEPDEEDYLLDEEPVLPKTSSEPIHLFSYAKLDAEPYELDRKTVRFGKRITPDAEEMDLSVIAFGQKGHPAMYEPVPEPEPELDEFDEDDEFYADKPPIEYAPFVEHFFDDEEEQQPSAEEDDDLPWFMR